MSESQQYKLDSYSELVDKLVKIERMAIEAIANGEDDIGFYTGLEDILLVLNDKHIPERF